MYKVIVPAVCLIALAPAALAAGVAFPPFNGVLTVANGGTGAANATLAKMQKLAAAAARSNLEINPVSAAAATIAATATAPSTSGFTNLLPAASGFAASFTGTTTLGGNVLTGVSSTGGLAVGMPLVENTSGANYPANIPLGAVITAVNAGASTVTMSKPAAGSAGVTARAASDLINYIGGVPANYGGNFQVSAGTTGNYVAPPTAQTLQSAPYALEFYTDAANFTTSGAGVILQIYPNSGVTPNYKVAIDDVYQTATQQAFASTATQYLTIQFAAAGTHKVRIELEAARLTQALWIKSGATAWKPSDSSLLNVAFFGDSYFQGGAGWGHETVAARLAKLMGWNYDLNAVAGTGYVNNGSSNYAWSSSFRTRDVAIKPYDAIVVLGSVNDSGTVASIASNALTAFQGLRANAPNAPIFVFGVPTTAYLPQSTAGTMENNVLAAFQSWADPNSFFIPVTNDPDGDWITSNNQGAYINSDNTHLNDPSGTGYYASKMAQKIKAILQSSVKY